MNSTSYAGYLFAYFIASDPDDGEQIRFARSVDNDPLHWQELNDGAPVLRVGEGTGGARDLFLLRAAGLPGETAKFYLLATDLRIGHANNPPTWDDIQRRGSRSIFVWESQDLVEWSSPRLIEVAPPEAGNAWAPEATFDPDTGGYFVYWASKLYPAAGPREGIDSYNRMLAATTTDFRSFSEPFVWSDPGRSVIDATVVHHDGWYYRFVKDERTPDSSTFDAKFITLERSRRLRSTRYEFVAAGLGAAKHLRGAGAIVRGEGPIIVPSNTEASQWYLFIDEFGLRGYRPFTSNDIGSADWTPCRHFTMPRGVTHGSVLQLTAQEWARVGERRGNG